MADKTKWLDRREFAAKLGGWSTFIISTFLGAAGPIAASGCSLYSNGGYNDGFYGAYRDGRYEGPVTDSGYACTGPYGNYGYGYSNYADYGNYGGSHYYSVYGNYSNY